MNQSEYKELWDIFTILETLWIRKRNQHSAFKTRQKNEHRKKKNINTFQLILFQKHQNIQLQNEIFKVNISEIEDKILPFSDCTKTLLAIKDMIHLCHLKCQI